MQLNPLHFSTSTFNTGSSWFPNNSGVRVTYMPTGEYAECSEGKSQWSNRAEAYKQLLAVIQPELDKQLELDF